MRLGAANITPATPSSFSLSSDFSNYTEQARVLSAVQEFGRGNSPAAVVVVRTGLPVVCGSPVLGTAKGEIYEQVV